MAEFIPSSHNDINNGREEEQSTSALSKQFNNTVPVTKVLTAQLVHHYEGIKTVEKRLKELLDSQEECICGLSEENAKFNDIKRSFNFNAVFDQMSIYTKKLNHLRNSMMTLDDRVARLKHRSRVIKVTQEKRIRERREAKAREEEMERLLTAKPVWEVDTHQPTEKKHS